jgi:phosphatidylserine/phosphatidylglycerophosphate/cardiolipin synthase-like enzyme
MPTAGSRALLALLLFSPAVWGLQSAPQTLAATGSMEIAFSPEQDVAAMVIKAIDLAHRQILVQAFSFTHKGIAQALIAAQHRGVDVKLIADGEQMEHIKGEQVSTMAQSGVQVWIDSDHQNAHNKVMVIDCDTPQTAVITGSYNFTYAAQYNNAENLLLIRGNNELAHLYKENWLRHQAHSKMLH